MPTVGIVEDHRLTRMGIEQVLARSPWLDVIASVGTLDEFAETGLAPDVIVLDPAPYLAEASLEAIGALSVDSAVLIMSPSDERDHLLAAVKAGAYGFVTKYTDDTEFLSAVEALQVGVGDVQAVLVDQDVGPEVARAQIHPGVAHPGTGPGRGRPGRHADAGLERGEPGQVRPLDVVQPVDRDAVRGCPCGRCS